jgi:hypothetical protein
MTPRENPQFDESSPDGPDDLEESPPGGEHCTTIDYDAFERARRDPRVIALLRDADLEGERLEREGRVRWAGARPR